MSEPVQYQLLGPEGFPDRPDGHQTVEDLVRAAAAFVLRFRGQGYYLDTKQERIPIDDLPGMLGVSTYPVNGTLAEAYTAYVNDNLERIGRDGWVPVCFEEFCSSEECREYLDPERTYDKYHDVILSIREGLAPFNPEAGDEAGEHPNNGDRAEWGEGALEAMDLWGGEPRQDYHYKDAICDILHAAYAAGHDPSEIVRHAVGNFEEETNMPVYQEPD